MFVSVCFWLSCLSLSSLQVSHRFLSGSQKFRRSYKQLWNVSLDIQPVNFFIFDPIHGLVQVTRLQGNFSPADGNESDWLMRATAWSKFSRVFQYAHTSPKSAHLIMQYCGRERNHQNIEKEERTSSEKFRKTKWPFCMLCGYGYDKCVFWQF